MTGLHGERTARWVVDPRDPRAPPMALWNAMSAEERAVVVDALPSETELDAAAPPEGDDHYDAADAPRKTLRRFFDRLGRSVYVGTNLSVYYPDEAMFAPDVFVVLDVDSRSRMRWVVADEGKGLDLAIEVHAGGDWRKDFVDNVARYARLGIREYFAFNLRRGVLAGHRLDGSGKYAPLAPGPSGYVSEVLGLDLSVDGDRVRFSSAGAPLPDLDELVARLEHAMSATTTRLVELERELEAERARVKELELELATLRRRGG